MSLVVLSEVQLGLRNYDVFSVELGIIEYLFVVVLRIFLARQELSLFFGVLVVLADLPGRPELPLGNVGEGSPEFDLQLGRVAELEQWLDELLIKEVNLSNRFLLQKLLDDSPKEGDGAGHPSHIAHEHSGAVGVR